MTDLTTQVLIEIRDEARKTNARLDQTNSRLDQTVARLDQTIARLDRLEHRQTESEIRISTEIVGVVGAINRLTDALLDPERVPSFTVRLDDHERRLGELERRS